MLNSLSHVYFVPSQNVCEADFIIYYDELSVWQRAQELDERVDCPRS